MSDTNRTDRSSTSALGRSLSDVRAVGEAARQVGGQARQAGAGALGQAVEVAHDAQARAGSLAGAVGEQVTAAAQTQKNSLADRLSDVAQAVHRSGEQLEGQQDWIAHLVERGADELTALAGTLRSNDLQGLLGNLGDLAKRQPALFVGASMAAGFALARVGRLAVSAASPGVAAGSPSTSPPPASPMPTSPMPTSPASLGGSGER